MNPPEIEFRVEPKVQARVEGEVAQIRCSRLEPERWQLLVEGMGLVVL